MQKNVKSLSAPAGEFDFIIDESGWCRVFVRFPPDGRTHSLGADSRHIVFDKFRALIDGTIRREPVPSLQLNEWHSVISLVFIGARPMLKITNMHAKEIGSFEVTSQIAQRWLAEVSNWKLPE